MYTRATATNITDTGLTLVQNGKKLRVDFVSDADFEITFGHAEAMEGMPTVKDENTNAQNSINMYGDAYDIFVPNDGITTLKDSEIGRISVHNHGKLNVSEGSKINQIITKALVAGKITIEGGAEVTSMNVNQHSASYPPKVDIKSGAIIETLDLNSIVTTNIKIEEGAIIGKIIWNGNEYTSIEDFKNAQ
jgi:hypothetical protein